MQGLFESGVWRIRLLGLALMFSLPAPGAAVIGPGPILTGVFASIVPGSAVDLTSQGEIDWVHWGLYTESSLDRKAGVVAQISDFTQLDATNGLSYLFQFSDNANGYSWSDGTPTAAVTNTTTGVWLYRLPPVGTGFQITAPADPATRTLQVYVGAFSARGQFEAYLSDDSAPGYVDKSLSNNRGNGPSGVYTITYAAGNTGQKLIVRWSLESSSGPDGNVTLQAAALTSSTANNPPFVALTGLPGNNNFPAGGNLTLTATANDLDGTIVNVEFFVNGLKLGESASSPYSYTWTNVPAGIYVLTARTKDNQDAISTSSPVELFVNGPGGSMEGSITVPPDLPRTVNLTMEGLRDWAHWGASSNSLFNHKGNVVPQIGDSTRPGTNLVQRYADNYTGYTWTDGWPILETNQTTTGVFLGGTNDGFELSVPADTTSRTLKVYVGLYGAQGTFQSWLSDFSAPSYTDATLSSRFGNAYAVYRLTYAAASPGQKLIVRYRSLRLFDVDYGNVTLQAATLVVNSAGNLPPIVQFMNPTNGAILTPPASFTFEVAAWDHDGQVQQVEFFNGASSLGVSPASPYRVPVSGLPEGNYTLWAVATDDLGARATNAVNIMVKTLPAAVVILSPARSGTDFSFSFAAESGRHYSVALSDSWPGANWQTLTNLTGKGLVVTIRDANSLVTQRFYRVEAQ